MKRIQIEWKITVQNETSNERQRHWHINKIDTFDWSVFFSQCHLTQRAQERSREICTYRYAETQNKACK